MKRIAMSAIAGFVLMAAIFFAGCSEDDFEAYYKPASDEDIVYEDNTCFVDSQILLSAQESVSQSKIKRIIKKLGGDIVGYISITNDYQIEFSDGKTLDELNDIIDTLDEEDDVLSVTLNYTGQTEADSVDYTKDPWTDDENPENVSGTIWSEASPSGNNWWAEAIMMPSVWETDLELESVKVGIIDTMFDTENEDLDEAFAETWNNPEDEDGNCMVSEMSRYEVEGSDHGTLVAGLIAADAEDEYGIAGVNEAAMLYGFSYGSSPVDTEEVSRWGSIFEFKYAVALMLNEGVKVINMSFGYPEMHAAAQNGDESALRDLEMYSTAWEDYLSKCLDAGYDFLIVKAAGNLNEADWVQCETSEEHPYGYMPVSKGTAGDDTEYDAAYDFLGAITDSTVKDHIIMVGSAENKDGYYAVAAHTCTGDRIDIYAPGVDVLCDYPDNVTKLAYGTSVAAPIVTGTASLAWSVNPDLSASQVADIIRASVSVTMFDSESVSNLFRTVETTPIVNAYVAVQLAEISAAEGGKALEETGIVTGIPYVIDADGQPAALENVTVTVYDSEGSVVDADTTETDIGSGSGGYDFVLPSGTYTITASLDGYDTASKEITVEGKTVLNVDFEMQKLGLELTDYYGKLEEFIALTGLQQVDSNTYESDFVRADFIDLGTMEEFIITNTDPSISAYGIKVGDTEDDALDIIEEYGLSLYYENEKTIYILDDIGSNDVVAINLVFNESGTVESWSVCNWPEGDVASYYMDVLIDAESRDIAAFEDWQLAFIEFILIDYFENYDDIMKECQWIYIDDDRIPELYIVYESFAGGSKIAYFNGNEIVTQHLGFCGLSYLEGENLFLDSWGHMDTFYDTVYTIQDGDFVVVASGNYGASDNSNVEYDANGYPIYQYYWNDIETTESEYQDMLNDVFDTSRAISPFDNGYNSSTGMYNGFYTFQEVVLQIFDF